MYPAYIPAPDADFANWATNFDAELTAAPGDYGLVAGDAVIVAAAVAAFLAAFALATNPATRTAPTVADKDAERAACEAVIRPYAVQISLNAAVTDLAKTTIGVTVRSLVPTPIPAPVTAPEIAIKSAIPMLATLTFKEPGAVGKAKPFGVIGMEVFRAIDVAPVADPTLASYNATVAKSPFTQSFLAGDQGKTVTYFARWTTKSGPAGVAQKGPWSAPLSSIVM